jgi:hypothetical protein
VVCGGVAVADGDAVADGEAGADGEAVTGGEDDGAGLGEAAGDDVLTEPHAASARTSRKSSQRRRVVTSVTPDVSRIGGSRLIRCPGQQCDQSNKAPGNGGAGAGGQAQVHSADEGGASQVGQFRAEEAADVGGDAERAAQREAAHVSASMA